MTSTPNPTHPAGSGRPGGVGGSTEGPPMDGTAAANLLSALSGFTDGYSMAVTEVAAAIAVVLEDPKAALAEHDRGVWDDVADAIQEAADAYPAESNATRFGLELAIKIARSGGMSA